MQWYPQEERRLILPGIEHASTARPNPIGLSLVRLRKRDGRRLLVEGLDYFDGTPILDIKGYRPEYRADAYTLPPWYAALMDARGHI
jgi:tRNA (Thr-GGU) A37 N-methylase